MTPERLAEAHAKFNKLREQYGASEHRWASYDTGWLVDMLDVLFTEIDALTRERDELRVPTLKPGQHRCLRCAGSGITRDPEPGEMVDV